MNVIMEFTTAMKTQHATILLDHLLALAILASLGMEPFVKVSCIFARASVSMPLNAVIIYVFKKINQGRRKMIKVNEARTRAPKIQVACGRFPGNFSSHTQRVQFL